MVNLTRGIFDTVSIDIVDELLARHLDGDWGDIDNEDKELNNAALVNGDRLVSSYNIRDDCKIWIITEADRSATTVLLPEEY